jgi:hypothetical protein
MIETLDYWIQDDKFIFKPDFNEPIYKYYDLISNCNALIFSNYSDINACIETNNKYNHKYNCEFSRFN